MNVVISHHAKVQVNAVGATIQQVEQAHGLAGIQRGIHIGQCLPVGLVAFFIDLIQTYEAHGGHFCAQRLSRKRGAPLQIQRLDQLLAPFGALERGDGVGRKLAHAMYGFMGITDTESTVARLLKVQESPAAL